MENIGAANFVEVRGQINGYNKLNRLLRGNIQSVSMKSYNWAEQTTSVVPIDVTPIDGGQSIRPDGIPRLSW